MKETVNEDTYQTLKEFRIDPPPHEKAIEPLWKDKSNKKKSPYKIFVASPVHSDVSMHYTQALLEFQKLALDKGVTTRFNLMKSSLVTQGRNLCVDFFMSLGSFGLVWEDILGAKERPKLLQKLTEKMIDFWIAPKTALGGLWGSKRGPRGGRPKFEGYAGGGGVVPLAHVRGKRWETTK